MDPHVDGMTDTAKVKMFGNKIKELVLAGTISPATDPDKDRQQVEAALSASGLKLKAGVRLHVHQHDSDNYHVTLPHKEQLEKTDARIAAQKYVLPDGYGFACLPQPQTEPDTLDFYDFRLGDYVLQHCQ